MTIEELLSSTQYPNKVILEKLVCHHLHITKQHLFTQNDKKINSGSLDWIKKGYVDYTVHKKPLEYILNKVSFLGVDFDIDQRALIPRPETEYMIQAINEHIHAHDQEIDIIDIGTGCGVLGLSVLYHNTSYVSSLLLCDLSKECLSLAQQNYNQLVTHADTLQKVEPIFIEANLLDHTTISNTLKNQKTILTANLPYIPDQLFDNNTDDTVKKREPRMAFVGGDDGLHLYRKMFDQLHALPPLSSSTMFLEMMTRQVEILRQEFPRLLFEEVKTFHFNIRIVKATIK